MNLHSWITLVGPGGAGKSTVGSALAERLGVDFVDLDRRFSERGGDISGYINRFGYRGYAGENVETCLSIVSESDQPRVIALSSGFMTYPDDIHPAYAHLGRAIESSPTTFVLIPSLSRDICVAETVHRQISRPFTRSAAREAAVIRERFPIYTGLRVRKIETMRPLIDVVGELIRALDVPRL